MRCNRLVRYRSPILRADWLKRGLDISATVYKFFHSFFYISTITDTISKRSLWKTI